MKKNEEKWRKINKLKESSFVLQILGETFYLFQSFFISNDNSSSK